MDTPESGNAIPAPLDILTNVDERKQIERRHALLDFALDHVREAAYLIDEHAHFLYVNAEACRALGFSSDELLGLRVADINPDWPVERSCEFWLTLKTHGSLILETRHKTKDGRIFPVELTANYFEYEGRSYNLALVRDITERKQLENDSRVREHYQRALLDNFPFMVWLKDTESRLLTVNRRYVEAAGHDATGLDCIDAFYGKTDLDFWPLELAEGYRADDREVLRTGQNKIVDEPIESHGIRRWHETYKAPVMDADGELLGTVGFARDITERKQREDMLRENGQRYRQIFDNVSDALYLLEVTEDDRFRYIEINPALEKSVGLSRDELIGKYFDEATEGEAVQKTIAKYRRCIKAGVATEEEIELSLPAGHRTFHSTLIPIRDDSGRIHRIVGISRDITERKHNEKLLRQQIELETRLAKIAEVAPGVFYSYLLKPDGTACMPYASPRLFDITGVRPEDAAKDASLAIWPIHPDDTAHVGELIAESARTMQPYHAEFRARHPVKGEIWIEGRSTPKRQPDGSTLWYGFLHDVTERKQHELVLKERAELERQLSRLAANVPGFVYTFRLWAEGRFSFPYASSGIRDIYGLQPEDVAEDMAPLHALAHPDDRPRIEAAIAESAWGLTPYHCEFRVLHPEKGEFWIEARSVPEAEPEGHILWHGIMLDITERKLAEELLHDREQEFRALVENSPDTVARYNRDCRRIYANPALVRGIGIPVQKLLGKTPTESGLAAEYEDKIRAVLESGSEDEFNLLWQTRNGKTTCSQIRLVPERDSDGQVASVLAIGRDITVLKEAERRLHESRVQIRELAAHRERAREEERKRIAREIHDELGQLLGALHLQVQFFRARFGKDDPVAEENIQYMANLVDKAQRVARDITSALRPAALDMGIVSALEWQAEEFYRHTGIHCYLSARNDILLDEERATAILRIVQESLTNVMRHSGANVVEILLKKQDDAYVLQVQDNGTGFEPHKTSKKKSFGLAGIRERAMMLGGDAVITSTQQQGTMLEVRLPISKTTGDLSQ